MSKEFLSKGETIPIHHQIYCHLKNQIEDEVYKENETIPSETELQTQFGVSRITVRRAIDDLSHDGFVKKHRGIGTIVLPKKSDRDLMKFQSFSGNAKITGAKAESVVLQCKSIEANVKIAEVLKVDIGEKVFFIKRLRLLNGRIIALHDTYVSGRLGFLIRQEDFNNTTSLYEYLTTHGLELGSADEICEAKMPSPEVKRELYLEDHTPILYKERITYSVQGAPLEYSENSYIADRYRYNIHIENARGDQS